MRVGQRSNLEKVIDVLVYLSVALGIGLLVQVYGLLPASVFFSIVGGWFAYLIAAILLWRRHAKVYPVILVLAVLTLLVSLPQPAHFALVTNAHILAAFTFIVGSAVQICLIVLIPLFLFVRRKR